MNIIHNRKNLYIILSAMVVMSVSWIISITHPLTRYDSRFVLHVNIGCNAVKRVSTKIHMRVSIKHMSTICKPTQHLK